MEIRIGKTSGFCYGVKNAVNKTNLELEKRNGQKVYCLGELVHNKTVTNLLKQKGLKFIEKIEQAEGATIIRAHGIEKEIYEKAKKRKIELIDLTCPSVLKIHKIIEEYTKNNYYIFLIGKKEHPEIIGEQSFCRENSTIISEMCDIETGVENFKKSKLDKILIIVQTTYSVKKFNEITNEIKNKISKDVLIQIKNTICPATEKRQKETKELSKEVDFMIIIGGKNSSNTNKLYEIAKENCKAAILIENESEIDKIKVSKYNKIGIMAGSSTPQESIEKTVKLLTEI